MSESGQYTFSVIIGRASTEDRRRILECLKALRRQEGVHAYEVIIADRRNDDISQDILQGFPEVKLLPCQENTTLPQLRTLALRQATGGILVVTEDHCVPALDWFTKIAEAFERAPSSTVAVGGCVENGLSQTRLDWATFFCEYSHFLSPVQDGNTEVLPGVNIAYRRTVFNDIEERTLISGFWETTLHPVLLRRGHTFYSCNAIRVYHCKKFSLKLFITQRFVYSRYYAGLRFGQNQLASRLLAACVSPLLPALVLCRMVGCIRAKRRLYYEFIRATPYLLLFTLVWALGELWGYLFGAGSALVAVE